VNHDLSDRRWPVHALDSALLLIFRKAEATGGKGKGKKEKKKRDRRRTVPRRMNGRFHSRLAWLAL